MSDYLAPLPVQQVAAWYRRLADSIGSRRVADVDSTGTTQQREPLAAILLRHYLENRQPGSAFVFDAPNYLKQNGQVLTQLQYQRAVFLTEQQARVGNRQIWAGVLPRIQGRSPFTRWDLTGPLQMNYESLAEIGGTMIEIARIQYRGTDQERDLFSALRGFQVHSDVVVTGQRLPTGMVRIAIQSWTASARDTYDFDFSEHLTLPNPDFHSTAADAVRPQDESLTVYHSNAQRLEQAHLAAPYTLASRGWSVTDARLTSPAQVDPRRTL